MPARTPRVECSDDAARTSHDFAYLLIYDGDSEADGSKTGPDLVEALGTLTYSLNVDRHVRARNSAPERPARRRGEFETLGIDNAHQRASQSYCRVIDLPEFGQ